MDNKVTIKILVDNKVSNALVEEHGFSALIQSDGLNILFDTGQGTALPANAKKLNCDLQKIDILILSHGHYDHTGAISHILSVNSKVKIFCHPNIFITRYSFHKNEAPKDVGISKANKDAILNGHSKNIFLSNLPQHFSKNVCLSGEIPRISTFEDTGGSFYTDLNKENIDNINDEQAIYIKSKKGLVIITGCCHAGLINTINHIKNISNCNHVHAIIGGFHLHSASINRLQKTINSINNWDIEKLVPCHCTGENASSFIKSNFMNKTIYGHSGLELEFQT